MTHAPTAFAELARRYCAVCERPEPADPRELVELLAGLCAAAALLPEIEPSERPDPPPKDSVLQLALPFDLYRECFDPFDLQAAPVLGSLRDDLSDVLRDVRRGLAWFEGGSDEDLRDACWTWRFHFHVHWGEHATGALRALYWLLRRDA